MTLRLVLTRHAKSAWDDPLLADRDRALNPRGIDAAGRIGRWLADRGYLPQEALVSSARRTAQTWALIAPQLPGAPEPRFFDALYHAGPDLMLRVLTRATGPTVLMLGHNPGIAALADDLVERPPAHPGFATYPTCATLVADFPVTAWNDLRPGTGRVVDFVVPRELPAQPG